MVPALPTLSFNTIYSWYSESLSFSWTYQVLPWDNMPIHVFCTFAQHFFYPSHTVLENFSTSFQTHHDVTLSMKLLWFSQTKISIPSSGLSDHIMSHCTVSPAVMTGAATSSGTQCFVWGTRALSKDFPHECHQPFWSKHSIKFQMAVPYHDGWFKKDRKAKT